MHYFVQLLNIDDIFVAALPDGDINRHSACSSQHDLIGMLGRHSLVSKLALACFMPDCVCAA